MSVRSPQNSHRQSPLGARARVLAVAIVALWAALPSEVLAAAQELNWDTCAWTSGFLGPQICVIDDGDVTINISGTTGGFAGGSPVTNGTLTNDGSGNSLFLQTDYAAAGAGPPYQILFTLDFNPPEGATNISFTMFDVDYGPTQWIDQLQIQAYDAFGGGPYAPTTITTAGCGGGNANNATAADTITGCNANAATGSVTGNASVSFAQLNITQITVLYQNTGTASGNQWISIGDIAYDEMAFLINTSKVATPAVSTPPAVDPGELIDYTITVANGGDTTAFAITVSDDIEAQLSGFTGLATNTCGGTNNSISDAADGGVNLTGYVEVAGFNMASGATCVITFSATVDPNVIASTVFQNTATVTASNNINDSIVANALQVPPPVLVSSTKVATPATSTPPEVLQSEVVTYTITIDNTSGAVNATDVSVTDDIPALMNGFTGTVGGTCSGTDDSISDAANGGANSTGYLDVNSFVVAWGDFCTITYSVTVDAATPGNTDFDNSFTVTSDGGVSELVAANTLTTPIADLSTSTKVATQAVTAGSDVVPGETVSYSIDVINSHATQQATNVQVLDDLPAELAGFTGVVVDVDGCSATNSSISDAADGGANNTGLIDLNSFTVAAASSCEFTFTATVSTTATDNTAFSNTVDITADDGIAETATSNTLTVQTGDLSTSTKVATPAASTPPDVNAGESVTYTIAVINSDATWSADNVQLVDDLPAEMSGFDGTVTDVDGCSATNSSISDAADGGANSTGYLDMNTFTVAASSQCRFTFTATVAAGTAGGTNIANTADITADGGIAETATSNTLTVPAPDWSTSTKTVTSPTPPDVLAGNSITYLITVTNSGVGTGSSVRVTDDIPSFISSYSITDYSGSGTLPAGWIDNSSSIGGANGNGYIDITIDSIAPAASDTITFSATVAGGTAAGSLIQNKATITSVDGTSTQVTAPTMIVDVTNAAGQVKELYWTDSLTQDLSRTPAASNAHYGNMNEGATRDLLLEAVTVREFTLAPGNMIIDFWVQRRNQNGNNRELGFILTCDICTTTTLATVNDVFVTMNNGNTWYKRTVTLNLPTAETVPVGALLNLEVQNDSNGGGTRRIRIRPNNPALNNPSYIPLNIIDPILVDSVSTYDAPYPAGVLTTDFNMGDTVYTRAVVSDPFGSADINVGDTAARRPDITIPSATVCSATVTAVDMTEIAALTTASTKTFEHTAGCTVDNPGTPSPGPAAGTYMIDVIGAFEGTEDAVSADGTGSFNVIKPSISVTKLGAVFSDPLGQNAYEVPGSVIRYTITVTNSGDGSPSAGTVVVLDSIQADLEMGVGVGASCGVGGPINFNANTSGLSFNCASALEYDDGGGFGYDPYPSATGFDGAVQSIRITPSGTFAPNSSFSFTFDARVE
jgi:fimbrial isopeptide formation D2 family protein/uncharacterized repeat protein (TIGR01451 family)